MTEKHVLTKGRVVFRGKAQIMYWRPAEETIVVVEGDDVDYGLSMNEKTVYIARVSSYRHNLCVVHKANLVYV